jgi:hypothetical protein
MIISARSCHAVVFFGLLALCIPNPTTLAGVSVDSDDSVDFERYETFAWKEGTPARRSRAQEHIVDRVETELAAHGLRRVQRDPDLWVVSHSLVDRHSLADLAKQDYWDYWTGVTRVDAYKVASGTLVLDLVDAEVGRVVWRGVATGAIRGPVDKVLKKLDKLIRKMLMQLPR